MAIGGSTNAVMHLIAIAGRLGIKLDLDEFDRISRRTPYIANIKPSGEYLMEDFFYAGGLPAVMKEILHLLRPGLPHGNGQDGRARTSSTPNVCRPEVIRTAANPLHPEGGTAVLCGQSGAGWSGDQADRGVAAPIEASRSGVRVREYASRCARKSIATICR